MNAVLNFPAIEEPARTEVAVAASAAIDLTKIDLADVALAQFGDWRGAVAAAGERLRDVAWDLKTTKGFADIKAQRNTLAKVPRADANKIADALVSKLTAVSKRVRAEQGLIVEAWDALAAPLTILIDARQAELDEEARLAAEARAEAARIEAARVQMHKERMATIGAYLTACQAPGMTAERIAKGMTMLEAYKFGPEWEDFAVPAANAQCETLEAMRVLHAQALGREQEAARQEAIRAENERVAAELAAERKRIDAEAAEIRRQAAELETACAAEQARIAREAQAKAEANAEAAAAVDVVAAPGQYPPAMAQVHGAQGPATATPGLAQATTTPAPTQLSALRGMLATMTVGQINERFQGALAVAPLKIDAAGLQALGFERQQRPGAATHFLASDWGSIKAAIIKHVGGLA